MELISVHIPKTAGVSFRKLLQTVYGEKRVVFDYADRILDPAGLYQADRPEWEKKERDPLIAKIESNPEARVLHGHFAADKYAGHFQSARRIVWLREPVARLVSHYHYWRGLPHAGHSLHRQLLEEGLSLEEFATLAPMRNIMSRVFLNGLSLEEFDFVGLQEYFDEDLAALVALLGWPGSAVPAKAAVENRGDASLTALRSLDEAARSRLAELNVGDVELYRRACEMRANRTNSLKPYLLELNQ